MPVGLFQRLADPFVLRALRADHPTRLGRSLLLLTVRGTRTGREFTLPVQYVRENGTIWVIPGHAEGKTWWRNLRSDVPVRVHVEGTDLTGTGRAISGDVDPEEVVRGLRVYLRRFPAAARAVGIKADASEDALRSAAARSVLVRIQTERGEAPPPM